MKLLNAERGQGVITINFHKNTQHLPVDRPSLESHQFGVYKPCLEKAESVPLLKSVK